MTGSQESTASPPLGRLHAVGGRRLMLHRSGTGDPAVVFLPGAGLVGLDYLNAHDRVAELTTSVIYDRAGTGWSDRVALPRTAAEVAGELHELLSAAEVPGPYLLVGHSLGGAYARRFAQRFPNDVCGMVLLDPFHEDLHGAAPAEAREQLAQMHGRELPEPTDEQLRRARDQAAPLFDAWPDHVRRALIDHHVATWRTGLLEDRNLYDDVAGELRDGPGLPRVPLIVLTALGHDDTQAQLWPPGTLRKINDAKTALHARLASSVERGEQRILDDAGHGWLHEHRQADMLEAIQDVLRDGTARSARRSARRS